MKIALVHDYLVDFGGAERVLTVFSKIFPSAPIYTLLYDAEKLGAYFAGSDIRSSFLNKLPRFIRSKKRWLLPVLPKAVESFDLSEYDLIISSSSAFAKGVIKKPGTLHVCYCHTPARFLWDYKDKYQKDNGYGAPTRALINFVIHFLRLWDKDSAGRVDFWIANSETTRWKIKEYYDKDSTVIYPPLSDLRSGLTLARPEKDYFLVVSRFSAYKKISVVIEAFNELGWPLIIIGEGPERKRLENISKSNIKFTGFVSDDKLAGYYANSKAFILANEEDFGLAALEAASFGKPALAYRRGGATEWLEEGKTGEFFDEQTKESIIAGARKMVTHDFSYDVNHIKKNTERFSEKNFRDNISEFINSHLWGHA